MIWTFLTSVAAKKSWQFSNVVNWWSCIYFLWGLTAMLDLSTDSIDQSKKLGWARDIMLHQLAISCSHYVPDSKCEMTDKLVSVCIISGKLLWYVNAMAAGQGSFFTDFGVLHIQMYSVYSLSCFWLTNECSSIDAFQDRPSQKWSHLSLSFTLPSTVSILNSNKHLSLPICCANQLF